MAEEAQSPARRVVAGIDGADSSQSVLRWALHLAALSGATVDAVTVWEQPVEIGWTQGFSYEPTHWNARTEAEKLLIQIVDDVCGTDAPAGLRRIVAEGQPAAVLLKCSKDAVALVVGSRGFGGVGALLAGSTSVRCAEHAECPVLVVHGDRPPPTI